LTATPTSSSCAWRRGVAHAEGICVLRRLVEDAGQLVKKDDLLRSVARDTRVSDGVLRVIILEIRRALGDDSVVPERREAGRRAGRWRKGRRANPASSCPSAEQDCWIRYRVRRGMLFFPDHDELYWNATGTDWPVPVDAAAAEVTLPAGGRRPSDVGCHTGALGARERAYTRRSRASEPSSPRPDR